MLQEDKLSYLPFMKIKIEIPTNNQVLFKYYNCEVIYKIKEIIFPKNFFLKDILPLNICEHV